MSRSIQHDKLHEERHFFQRVGWSITNFLDDLSAEGLGLFMAGGVVLVGVGFLLHEAIDSDRQQSIEEEITDRVEVEACSRIPDPSQMILCLENI